MVNVYYVYGNELAHSFSTYDEAARWLGKEAHTYNCGIMRMWDDEGYRYYDTGRDVYRIELTAIPESQI